MTLFDPQKSFNFELRVRGIPPAASEALRLSVESVALTYPKQAKIRIRLFEDYKQSKAVEDFYSGKYDGKDCCLIHLSSFGSKIFVHDMKSIQVCSYKINYSYTSDLLLTADISIRYV